MASRASPIRPHVPGLSLLNRHPPLAWYAHPDGAGRYYVHAETMERDATTNEFYGACTLASGATLEELKGAVLRLQQGFSVDFRFAQNRREDLVWYRSWTGWRK